MVPPVTRSQEEAASVERVLDQEEQLAIAAAAAIEQEQDNKEPSPEGTAQQIATTEEPLNRWESESVVKGEDLMELETLWAGALEDVMVGLTEREERMNKKFETLMAAMAESKKPSKPRSPSPPSSVSSAQSTSRRPKSTNSEKRTTKKKAAKKGKSKKSGKKAKKDPDPEDPSSSSSDSSSSSEESEDSESRSSGSSSSSEYSEGSSSSEDSSGPSERERRRSRKKKSKSLTRKESSRGKKDRKKKIKNKNKELSLAACKKTIRQEFTATVSNIGDSAFGLAMRTWRRVVRREEIPKRYRVACMSLLFGGAVKGVFESLLEDPRYRRASASRIWRALAKRVYNEAHRSGLDGKVHNAKFDPRKSTLESYAAELQANALLLESRVDDETLKGCFIRGLPSSLRRAAVLVSGDFATVVARVSMVHQESTHEKERVSQIEESSGDETRALEFDPGKAKTWQC